MGVHKDDKEQTAGAIKKTIDLREKPSLDEVENLLRLKNLELHLINQDIQKKSLALKTAEEELEKINKQLKKLATLDPLTNLANRAQLNLDLKREIARSERYNRQLALLHLDLDFFKKININFGHDVGDLLLKKIASRLQNLLREEDLIARLGGDKFAIILTEINNPHDVSIVANRIVDKMSEPFSIHNRNLVVNLSIGIACYPDAGTDELALQKSADIALNFTKASGRNNYQFFTYDLKHLHNYRLELETELHTALEKNELHLVYQPRLDIQSGKMLSLQVLPRWQQPKHGNVPPTEFLSLAEETGLIIQIGMWTFKTACKQLAEWRALDKNLTCSLAINVSPRQLHHKNFIEELKQALSETLIPADLIELELSEASIAGHYDKIEDALFQLQNLGVRFSIDHLTPSLSSLRQPETGFQFLIKNQHPVTQGYLYSKPLTVEEMNVLITKKMTLI